MNSLEDNIDFDTKIIFIVENIEFANDLQIFIQNSLSDISEIKIFQIEKMCLLELRNEPNIIIMDYFLKSEYELSNNELKMLERIQSLKLKTKMIILIDQENLYPVMNAIKDHSCCFVRKDENTFSNLTLLINKFKAQQQKKKFMWN